MREGKEKNSCSGEKRSMLSTVRKKEKMNIFRPNEMIQRKLEKKCLERQEVGKEDKKHVMGMTPTPPKKLKIGALFK